MKNKTLLTILGLGLLLRMMYLDKFPIGLYSDEAVFGYNAYLLLRTGHDEYNRFWPVSLESFGDWKPPMQAWLAIPFIKFLGLNEFAVRLPSALLGTGTIAVVYFLAKELFPKKLMVGSWQLNVGEMASLLLAISPWHIFMSRIAMLVAIEVFFVSLGVLGLIKGLDYSVIPAKAGIYLNRFRIKSGMTMINWWWVMAATSFGGAIYSYYGSRVTVPLLLSAFILIYFNKLKQCFRQTVIPIIVGAIILSPILIQSIKEPTILTGRAKTTSVFFNDNVRLQLWDAHTKAGLKKIPPVISRFFDNKLYYYSRDIVGRYVSHFSPMFLFFKGDSHPPFKIPGLGYLHLIDLPFFALGLWKLRSLRATEGSVAISSGLPRRPDFIGTPRNDRLFLILYLLVSPFVAGLTFLTPAANRSFNLIIPWTMITAFGLHKLFSFRFFNHFNHLTILTITFFFYFLSLGYFAYSYIRIIPLELPHYWHYGRKELVNKLKPLLTEYDKIYLTNKGGPPYIFLAFYLPIQPNDFYKSIKRNPIINELGWGHTDKILNVEIPREFDWKEVPKDPQALYIGFENEIPEDEARVLDRVYYPNGRPVYTLFVIARSP